MDTKTSRVLTVLLVALAVVIGCAGLVGCKKKGPELNPTGPGQYQEAIQAARQWQGPVHPVAGRLYEQGLEQYRAKNFESAASLLDQAVEIGVTKFPMRADAMIYQANALQKIGKYLESAKVARECAAEYPARWESRVILAEYWIWRENYDNAQKQLAAAARVGPREPEVLAGLARVQLYRGAHAGAVETARSARLLRPEDEDLAELYFSVLLSHGNALEQEGDRQGALTQYFLAASLPQVGAELPHLRIARLLFVDGHDAAAERYRQLAVAQRDGEGASLADVFALPPANDGSDVFEYLRMGDFYAARERPDDAAQQFLQAVLVDSQNAEAWFKLGLARATQLDDPPGARQCLYALSLLPEAEEAQRKQLAEAIGEAPEKALEPSPGYVMTASVGDSSSATGESSTEFPAGTRLYFNLILGHPAGVQQMKWTVTGPGGEDFVVESWRQEFFGENTVILMSGTWFTPGEYSVRWESDGAVRAEKTFVLK